MKTKFQSRLTPASSALSGAAGAKTIKVLGTGCANCKNTLLLIEEVARAKVESWF